MYRALQPVTFEEIKLANDGEYSNYYPNPDMEYKPENWGKIEGKIVCLDYGIDELELITKIRRKYREMSST